MNFNPVIVLAVAAVLFLIIIIFLFVNNRSMNQTLTQMMGIMTNSLNQAQGNMNKTMSDSGTLMADIQKKLGMLEQSTNHMQEIGRDITRLQNILQAPKLRGNLGEYLLYELLSDVLPSSNYKEQYHFKDGLAVDAVIKLGRNLVPVDSKFPMESFVRYVEADSGEAKKKARSEFAKSIKGRIDEISKKYIRPAEGTFDFALMYVPAENVYYEILVQDEEVKSGLFEYAMKRKVVPVSPSTFYAYLMAIVYGLRGFKIEQQAQVIVNELSGVQNAFADFTDGLAVLGKHLSQAEGKFNELNVQAEKINGRVKKITGVE